MVSSLRRFASSACLAAVYWSAWPAAAQDPSAAEKETARSLMDEGDQLVAAGDKQQALERYRAAHQIMGVPTTGIELAKTQAALGLLVEANATAIQVANSSVGQGEPSVFAEARAAAAALAQQLSTTIPSLTISVSPAEAEAQVSVDDVQLPSVAVGLPYRTNPGEHRVVVTAPGYEASERNVQLAEGQQASVQIELLPRRPDPAVVQPVAASPLPPASSSTAPAPTTDTPLASSHTSGYVALGIAGVGVVVGSVAGALAVHNKSDAERFCEGRRCSSAAKNDLDAAKSFATVANIGFGVGIVAGAYALWDLVLRPNPAAATSVESSSDSRLQLAFEPRGWTGGTLNLEGAL